MVKQGKETIIDKVIKMSKQLYEVAKYSPDIRKCVEVAVTQIIGNKELSEHCMQIGITKNEYIEFILKKITEN